MAPTPPAIPIPEREAFENGFFYFCHALDILAAPPADQCELVGNYNVAWELKSDVSAGSYLLTSPSSARLSTAQREGITDIIAALESIPSDVLVSCSDSVGNLAAMSHESWSPLRAQASKLLILLEPALRDCKRYLGEPGQ
jgi:hypothetical protein